MNKNKVGRPRGKRKTAKIEVLIEPEIKEKFMDIVSFQWMTSKRLRFRTFSDEMKWS